MSGERAIKRALVMLEYAEGDPDNGEVFDLTALADEMASKCPTHEHAIVYLEVCSSRDYSLPIRGRKTTISWKVMADFKLTGVTGHLDDAINASIPDSEAAAHMRKKSRHLADQLEKLNQDILVQKLRDAAAIRHQHPIARVTQTVLPEVAKQIPHA